VERMRFCFFGWVTLWQRKRRRCQGVDAQCRDLGEDVADLRFDLRVKGSQRGGSGTGPGCVGHAEL
jgi:hypothetical protein